MWYGLTLAAHILVACLTLGTLVISVYALFFGKTRLFKLLAVAIALFAVLEVVSGFLLAVLSPTLGVMEVGLHLLAYLGVCLAVEAVLVFQMRRVWIS